MLRANEWSVTVRLCWHVLDVVVMWRCISVGRVLAYQVQSPGFDLRAT